MRKLKLFNQLKALPLLAIFAVSSAFAAEYYTWVDENGVTNYSQRSPEGYSAEHITESQRFGRRKLEKQPV
ncbi:MAG TPA: hypothetical protein DCM54_13640 [Gammaproteobacteria bacterium]|nr:hypothetical protein [Gammaproteobacteria bacterium]|tara:strand:- start:2240 stop:2452 length:213 start_codon:yes stop_codon:yes gene_type:complete